MDTFSLLAVALALAMDASAVAVGIGLATRERALACAARVGLQFGLFQAGMTLAGYLAGSAVSGRLKDAGSWVAAALLWAVAAHMMFEAIFKKTAAPDAAEEGAARRSDTGVADTGAADAGRGLPLLALSVATSIDAAGAGVSFALLDVRIWLAVAVIGLVATALPAGAVLLARRIAAGKGGRFSRAAAAAGACVLVAIGIRIVVAGS